MQQVMHVELITRDLKKVEKELGLSYNIDIEDEDFK